MNVVILGGGYAGIWCYRALCRWLGSKVKITLVSRHDFHSFHGFISDAIGGHVDHSLLHSPLSECAAKAERITGEITLVNEAAKQVTVLVAGQERLLAYDQLVIATGATERTAHIPGLAEHGWRLREPEVTAALIKRLDEVVAVGSDEASRTVVVVGSGFTGTETASAVARRLGPRGRVVLLVAGSRLIPSWAKREFVQLGLRKNLTAAQVEVLIDSRAAEVRATEVLLGDGAVVPSRTVINACGNLPVVPKGIEHHIDPASGLLQVDRALRVAPSIWAVGDVAAVLDRRGAHVTKDALWAIATGTRAGRNIARVARGAAPKAFNFLGLGSIATFAPYRSVGTLWNLPVRVPALAAFLIRQGLFFWFVPSRKNSVRLMRSFYAFSRPARTAR